MTRILDNLTTSEGLAVRVVDITPARRVNLVVPNLLAAPDDTADLVRATVLGFLNPNGSIRERPGA